MPAISVDQSLDAIERLQPSLNAFITVTAERAHLAPAEGGLLAGVPFAVKDLVATAGVRTTAGSKILADWVPKRDAPVVRALEAAGGRCVGKTNTHEFAFGTTNDNPHYGATKNPWNTALTTGGSSGGSAAAVAAGIVPMAVGTDTAGSVRIPAALCGCVGFKPGRDTISRRGVVPLSRSLDTVGFLGATVHDTGIAFCAATGCAHPAHLISLKGVVVGVPDHYVYERVNGAIVEAVERALRTMERQGAVIRRIKIPSLAKCPEIGLPIVRCEARVFHARWFPKRRADYGADLVKSLEAAEDITVREYLGAQQARRRLTRTLRSVLEDVNLLAGPTVPILAFPNKDAYKPILADGELPRHALTRLTYPFSLSRLPAISIPCDLSPGGLPIGLQLAAGPGREAWLLSVANGYEKARGEWEGPRS